MKNYYIIISIISMLIIVVFSFAYYYSYKRYTQKMEVKIQSEIDNFRYLASEKEKNHEISNHKKEQYSEVIEADSKNNTISEKTRLVLVYYDIPIDYKKKIVVEMPKEFYGFSISELNEYLEMYIENLSDEDRKKGMIGISVLSFSSEEVIIEKRYDTKKPQMKYFIKAENGYITIYESDKETVYESTNIDVNLLPEDELNNLLEGFYIADDEELESIMENYSS